MQFTTTFVTLVAVLSATLAAATPVVEARQDTLWCGKQPYVKGDYTCFPQNGNLLCPIDNGVVYQACGYGASGACYNPNQYTCVNGHLCPKSHPLRCGDACYNIKQYYCENGVLKQQRQRQ